VSPFLGRFDDIGNPGIDLVERIAEIFKVHKIDTEIISASVRNPKHVLDVSLNGSHIATVPYSVKTHMDKHPLTDSGIEKFISDYKDVFEK
ncbi:fructose-6-phosphate aldolase, partial [Clostridium perfringens]